MLRITRVSKRFDATPALAGIGQRFLSWQDSYRAASERKNVHAADRPRLQAV